MQFKKGNSGNPAGRPKGTPNKATATVKKLVANFLFDNFEKFTQEAANLEGKEFCAVYLKLIDFELPKLSRQATAVNFSDLSEQEAEQVLELLAQKIKDEK